MRPSRLNPIFARMRVFPGVLFFAGLAWITGSAVAADDWKIVRQQNRDYVTFADVARFYQFPEYTRASGAVSLRSERRVLRAHTGTSDLYLNGVRFFTDFPLLTNGSEDLVSAMDVSKIIEPVLRPNKLPDAAKVETVVLDPGHGGTDQGTSNRWGTEKAFALDVALSAREQLLRAGYKVELTRKTDVGLSLEERVTFANRFPRAVFVSIHFNSASGGAGIESYALAPAGVASNAAAEGHATGSEVQANPGNAQDGRNMALTAAVHASALSHVTAFDRGIRHARFHVLRDIRIPALLLEGGFLSDPAEGQRIATAQYRQQLGAAIAVGIQSYDGALNFRAGGGMLASAKSALPAHEHSITEPLEVQQPTRRAITHEPSVSINGGE